MHIFLHGFLGAKEDWDEIVKQLDVPYRCLTLPGHGGTPLNLDLLEKEIQEKVTLVGYSLGGRLAIQFAHTFPERVEKLILLSINPGLETGLLERIEQDEKWATLLEEKGIDHFLEKWYEQPLFASLKIDQKLLERRKNHDPHMLAKVLRTLSPAKLPNLWPELENFSFPLLFLFGEDDIKYKLTGKRLEKKFLVKWIPKSGHAVHLENPNGCASFILNNQ